MANRRCLSAGIVVAVTSTAVCRAETPCADDPRVHMNINGISDPCNLLPVGIWATLDELAALPRSGEAWESLLDEASGPPGQPDIADQDDDVDVRTLAKALVWGATGAPALRQQVIATCMAAIDTEDGGRTLALGRNLVGYVIAADIVGLPPAKDAAFKAWLVEVLDEELDGRTLRSTHEDRPNNWGTHAGASRAAVARYLEDDAELAQVAAVFKGWLGDRDSYDGFEYGELWWQADPSNPVGINPVGATINGHSVDGVLPDDQRRGGPFEWPPPAENYVYEALQGAVVTAMILHRAGYDAFEWEDRALLRAYRWLHAHADYPAEGDDTWQPHLVNARYGTLFPQPVPCNHGKNMGFTDWTHASCNADLNDDGQVSSADLVGLLSAWGTDPGGPPDFDRDDDVAPGDLLAMLANWGACDQ